MHVIEWYVGFRKPHRNSFVGRFGHVTAWGYTMDDTWIFLDFNRTQLDMAITHIHDEVTWMIAQQLEQSELVLKLPPAGHRRMPVLPMTCASTIGHLVGVRAWTPWGLKRKLLAQQAEIVKWVDPKKTPTPSGTESANAASPSLNAVAPHNPTHPA